MRLVTNPTKLEFFSDEVANKISFFEKGDTFVVSISAKTRLKQGGKNLEKQKIFTLKRDETNLKIVQSQINSFIKKVIAKDYNPNKIALDRYQDLNCKITNLSENLEYSFVKTGVVPMDKQKTKTEIALETLNQEQVLSNLEDHLDKVYTMDITRYKFSLECIINSTLAFFEENPEIDYIAIYQNTVYFGIVVNNKVYFKEKVLFPSEFTSSNVCVNRNKQIAFTIYDSNSYNLSQFEKLFKSMDLLVKEYEELQAKNRKYKSYGRQNY